MFQCYKWFWSCLPLWTATCLHSISYTTLFFWHPHAENPTTQTQDSRLSHLLLLWTPHLHPTRQCPQTTTFEDEGEPKQIRTEVPLLTSLTPYRWAKHHPCSDSSRRERSGTLQVPLARTNHLKCSFVPSAVSVFNGFWAYARWCVHVCARVCNISRYVSVSVGLCDF